MNKLGRPRRDGSKTEKYLVRMSKSDMEMLQYSSEKLGVSKSEVLRKGLATQYRLAKLRDNHN